MVSKGEDYFFPFIRHKMSTASIWPRDGLIPHDILQDDVSKTDAEIVVSIGRKKNEKYSM